MMQNTNHLLMIRPVKFGYNAQTAINNSFQSQAHQQQSQEKALKEFDAFVEVLRTNEMDVTVINDTEEPHTPDSVFPNNWISFHGNTIVLYPMFAENRRAERKAHVLRAVEEKFGFKKIIDLTYFEQQYLFLEGTGSMVFDRINRIAYACLSPRTNENVLNVFCEKMSYSACTFKAVDEAGSNIYHTNVMMCVADKFVVLCLDCITDKQQRQAVEARIKDSDKKIIEINYKQVNHFAGNMLQVINKKGQPQLVMSQQAFNVLNKQQLDILSDCNNIITSDIFTIEMNGGGSARCMLAEVFI